MRKILEWKVGIWIENGWGCSLMEGMLNEIEYGEGEQGKGGFKKRL
jgi:hypothetical protein